MLSETLGLSGKVAIVTGSGARGEGIGNGRAAAIRLAAAGARVLIVDREAARAVHTARMIEAEGGEAVARAADVTDAGDCAALVAEALSRWGRLDILDNNVGIGSRGTVLDIDEAEWERVLRVNVGSMFLMAKQAIPAMLEGGRGGAIVNVSSIAAMRPRGLTAYSTSKGAVEALTRAMAVDHGQQGIRVNAVVPGPVYTPLVAEGMSEELRERRRRASLLGIEGTGWDVAHAVVFLASDWARYITGQMLIVDGGTTLAGPAR